MMDIRFPYGNVRLLQWKIKANLPVQSWISRKKGIPLCQREMLGGGHLVEIIDYSIQTDDRNMKMEIGKKFI